MQVNLFMVKIIPKGQTVGFFFQTIHHGDVDKFGLASELERFANDQWVGEHYTFEQASSLVMERFKKMIEQELKLIELRAQKEQE